MRLALDLAPRWSVTRRGDGQEIHVEGAPGLRVEVSPIMPLPEVMTSWAQTVLRADLPPQSVLNILLATDLPTVDGWKLSVIESQALAITSKEILESRIHLFYTFMFHCATVIARSANADEFEAHRAELLDRFGAARPDWSGEIVALAQILPPGDPPAEPKP